MDQLEYMKAEDRLRSGTPTPGGEVDPTPILGHWYATDKEAGGIAELILSLDGGRFTVRAFGANAPDLVDWGPCAAQAYGGSVSAREAMAFSATYDFEFMNTLIAAYGKQGILVVDTFNVFKDGSERAPYFTREFFHR